MANNKIILKKSSVLSKIPQISDLEFGELALNYNDGKLYFKNASNQIEAFFAGETAGFTGVFTDETLSGNGLQNNELGVNYPTINVLDRAGDIFSVIVLPYLQNILRYGDGIEREPTAIVFDRNDAPSSVMVG